MTKLPEMIQHELDRVHSEIRALRQQGAANAEQAAAERAFMSTGPTALPMTRSQVAMVLAIKPATVGLLVHQGYLVKRFRGNAPYHPDDVRAYLTRSTGRDARATEQQAVLEQGALSA